MLSRRGFLRALGIGAGAVALAPVLPFAPSLPVAPPSPSIRFVQNYVATTDTFVSRMDVLYGWAAIDPSYANSAVGRFHLNHMDA